MILVDTSVWIDHLRSTNASLADLLGAGAVLGHPWVVGELALGHLRDRTTVLTLLLQLPQAPVATDVEVRTMIEDQELRGLGIGYVDAQLLAATLLANHATLWTSDRRLRLAAQRLECLYVPVRASGDRA